MSVNKARYPIIVMWSHPRSMSTAVERIMRERGDLACLHEPFMYDYYVHRQVRVMPHFDLEPERPQSYEDIRDHILRLGDEGPVFVKDMSYYVMPRILDDRAFCARITSCFLIRDPLAAILSYHKLDPDLTLEEIGIEAQWRHFDGLRQMTGTAPAVLASEDIRADARGIVGKLWNAVGLPANDGAFEWQSETPGDWQQVSGWHGDVTSSASIQPLDADEAARKADEFARRAAADPRLRPLLDHHEPFFRKLRAHRLAIGD